MNMLDEWTERVVAALGLDPADLDRDLVLDVARDVAHDVARPAAPLTVFLLGLAAGRAGGDPATIQDAAQRIRGLLPASPGN